MKVLIYLLLLAEVYNVVAHVAVLLYVRRLVNFTMISNRHRRIYFAFDLASCICSWAVVGRTFFEAYYAMYATMILIHVFVHVAVQVFWTSKFVINVMRLAEGMPMPTPFKLMYIAGTLQDILTHGINAGIMTVALYYEFKI
jgi:hypothetical protein